MKYFVGVDIGSTCAKTVVMDEKGSIVEHFVQPTGWSSVDTAMLIKERLVSKGIDQDNSFCVATGYGRISVPFAGKAVTEITCHAKGACFIHNASSLAVIDIGGQDTKVIRVSSGKVREFQMNDKCSAGTGRFLEVMANKLGISPAELCTLASHGGGISISSMCTVFAESEVISLVGKGESRENIAFAIVDSIIKKVSSMASKLCSGAERVCLTGGLCDCDYICVALSRELKCNVVTSHMGRYAGAIGAALCAKAETSGKQ